MIKFTEIRLLNTDRRAIIRVNDIKEVMQQVYVVMAKPFQEDRMTVVRMQDNTIYECHKDDYHRLDLMLCGEEE